MRSVVIRAGVYCPHLFAELVWSRSAKLVLFLFRCFLSSHKLLISVTSHLTDSFTDTFPGLTTCFVYAVFDSHMFAFWFVKQFPFTCVQKHGQNDVIHDWWLHWGSLRSRLNYLRRSFNRSYTLPSDWWNYYFTVNSEPMFKLTWDRKRYSNVQLVQHTNPMMTSSNGNIFRVTFTGHRWIPSTKASDAELWCFLRSAPWINSWVNNREVGDLRRHRTRCDVTVTPYKLRTIFTLYFVYHQPWLTLRMRL